MDGGLVMNEDYNASPRPKKVGQYLDSLNEAIHRQRLDR